MSGGGGGDSGEFGLQIAPMLDILFVLLLFFMVSTGAQKREAELGVKLPGFGPTLPGATILPVNVDINASGQVFFNSAPIDTSKSKELKSLQAKLEEQISKFGPKQQVVITPSLRTKHERVVDVLNACSAAKVKNLSFGVASS